MSTLYQIRHVTRHRYQSPVTESIMEVRKCPLSQGRQRRLNFNLVVDPSATLFQYEEAMGNIVYHFTIPQALKQLSVIAEALVEIKPFPEFESYHSTSEDWARIEQENQNPELLDFLLPSPLVPITDPLKALFDEVAPQSHDSPLEFLLRVRNMLSNRFDYTPMSTQVDSPIDHALEAREGVCQDFAHIMVGLARLAGVPARYVSGYLYHRQGASDRSQQDASHAWMEAHLPEIGWLGFDPTNNIMASERHIRTCLGRDYRDVPPTRGVYRGSPASELSVAVQVHPADLPNTDDEFRRMDESDPAWDQWKSETEAQQAQQQ